MDLNLIAPINNLSYGIVSVNILHELTKLGYKIALFPINPQNIEAHPKYHDSIRKGLENAKMPNFEAPNIRIWHQHDMSMWVGYGQTIGFPIFELDKFTEQEKHHLIHCDELFVCSEWAKSICIKELQPEEDKKKEGCRDLWDFIHVIPLGVDTTVFHPGKSSKNCGPNTIFFTAGKFEIRKGHDILVECFNRAFELSDNVELWMLCDNVFFTPQETAEWKNLYLKSKLGSKVKFLPRVETQEEVAQIMRNTDFGVFLSRAEGWNLELLEMMATGKWCIATDCTAHKEFCNQDNSNLISCPDTEVAFDGKWFTKDIGSWHSLGDDQIEQVVQAMRNYHQMKQTGHIFNKAGVQTAKKFSWSNCANSIISVLNM